MRRSDRVQHALAVGVLALFMGATASGCQLVDGAAAGRQRAQTLVDAWEALIAKAPPGAIVVTDGLTHGGGWNGVDADNAKQAFLAGLVQAATPLSSQVPAPAALIQLDGSSQMEDLISPAAALDRLVAELGSEGDQSKCDCQPLTVLDAKLASVDAATSRGQLTLPAWQFVFPAADEPTDPITFVAVRDVVSTVPGLLPPPNGGDWADDDLTAAYGNAESTSLGVSFEGAPYRGDNACGSDYSANAVESDHAVVVVVTPSRQAIGVACSGAAVARTATATLSRPLGDRTVLEMRFGTPVELREDALPTDAATN